MNMTIDDIVPPATPGQFFSYTITNPAIPFTSLMNSVILLLNAYNVRHSMAFDQSVEMSVDSGNVSADARFQSDYINFKMFLDGINREFQNVVCTAQGTGIGLRMNFECR